MKVASNHRTSIYVVFSYFASRENKDINIFQDTGMYVLCKVAEIQKMGTLNRQWNWDELTQLVEPRTFVLLPALIASRFLCALVCKVHEFDPHRGDPHCC